MNIIMKLRFIDFDAQYFDRVPYIFGPLDPFMTTIKDFIYMANEWVGLPWWAVLVIISGLVRMTIFPLILLQMKRMAKLAPSFPAFVLIKDTWKVSSFTKK